MAGDRLQVSVVKTDPRVTLPAYESEGAAGMDIRALLAADVIIPAHARAKIPTGLIFEIPTGYEAQVRPRSGLAARAGITVLNAPGTIDSDYRGEVQVILLNTSNEDFTVKDGDRIAQMVIAPVIRVTLVDGEVSAGGLSAGGLSATTRGAGGFGSTGI